MNIIEINTEYITLVQLFKLANIVSSGGEFKYLLESGEIYLNDEVQTAKRKKIYPGDKVKYQDLEISVIRENK